MARQTAYLVINAPDDKKLDLFEQAFIGLRDKLAGWVSDGFQMYFNITQDPALAEQRLREFLAPKLGQQMKPDPANEWHQAMAVWYRPSESPHKTIVWWVAAASVDEGHQFFGCVEEREPDEPPETDAEMLSQIDAELAEQWMPPPWLWRSPDFNGKREVSTPQAHSRRDTICELAYIHCQVWEAIEDAITAAKLRAEVTDSEAQPTGPAPEIKPKPIKKSKPARINPEYKRIYIVMKETGALKSECEAMLEHAILEKLCEELDRQNIPLPKRRKKWADESWSQEDRNWTGALYFVPHYLKPHLGNVPKRYCQQKTPNG
jgi:hypothetical protein